MAYDQEHLASFGSITRRTVAIVHRGGNGQLAMGSGVLIDIANRRFVATAYHCLPEAVLFTEGMLIPNDNSLPAPRIPILKQGGNPQLDVGFLEIDKNAVIKTVHEHHPCELSQLYIGPGIKQGLIIHICGWPEYGARLVGPMAIERSLEGIMVVWKRMDDKKLYFEFEGKSGQWNDQGKWVEKSTPTPRGFSGGGCWAIIKSRDDELYDPNKHVRLLAIQSAWDTVRTGIAILIGEWVRVIGENCPDLKDFMLAELTK